MPRSIILTNNKSIALRPTDVLISSPNMLAVLETARDYVHLGHHLLTHPLAGSVKPNENPCRSLVLTCDRLGVDPQSVQLIEGCLSLARRMLKERPLSSFPPSVLADLELIDRSLLETGVESLRLAGHF
ncbi:MAG: hypothetical protein DDT34_01239 [Firmicutes bacterium]|nr:hypothetical protein [Bacillota bacterium]MBT9152663.1 hypothetical protein [Bacillota bacterium]MBT9158165.1 hypothetical protein [Bacillota bacterium]